MDLEMEDFVFSIRSEFRSFENGERFNEVEEHELEASSSKGESRKGSKNPVSCSKKYPDVVETDRSEFLSCDRGTSSNQNTRVPIAGYAFSSYDTIRNGLGWICIDLYEFESGDSEDSDFVAEEDNPSSVSVGESSSVSEEVDEVNTEELNSENNSGKSEDEGECDEKEASKRKYISSENPMVEESDVSSGDDCDEFSSASDNEFSEFSIASDISSNDSSDELWSCGDYESEVSDESDGSGFVVESKKRKQSTESGDLIVDPYSKRTRSNDVKMKKLASYAFSSYDTIRNGLGWICVDLHEFEIEDSEDSDFVVEDNPSLDSVEESSFDSEEVDEVNTKELNSENESGKSEDEGECGDEEPLKRKYISGEDPMVEEIFVSPCDACDELSSCGVDEREDSDESDGSDFVVESKKRKQSTETGGLIIGTSVVEPYFKSTRSNDVKRKKLGSEREGYGDMCGPKNDCHDIDKRVHKKHPSIVMEKGEPTKRRRISAAKSEDILNSILDKENIVEKKIDEAKESLLSDTEGIPLKFRFDVEDPQKVEKSEIDLMVDDLFAEMEYALKCEEINFLERLEVGNEKEEDDMATEVNQIILCSRGRHQPFFDEQIGLICHFCRQVLLESKYVLPPLVMNLKAKLSERTYYVDRKDIPTTFDDFKQKVSGDNSEGFFYDAEGTVWDVMSDTVGRMYPHQQEGFEFLWKNLKGTISLLDIKNSDPTGVGGCIISHAPGTGKTRLTLVFLESFLKVYPYSLPVIIAPASVLLTWEEEFRKWKVKFPFYNLNNLELKQNKNVSRAVKLQAWRNGRSILGVSYNLYEKLAGEKCIKETGKKKKRKVKVFVSQEVEKMRKILLELPGLVVLDEGHTPRNRRSSIWNTILQLNTKKRVILSGTPFQNSFEELFNTLRLVRPDSADALAEEKDFMDMIKLRKKREHKKEGTFCRSSSERVFDEVIDRLKMTIMPFVHVHRGSILQESLPGLRDSVILLTPPALQKRLIDGIQVNKCTLEFEHKVALVSLHPSLLLHCSTLSENEKSIITKEKLKRLRLKPDEGVKMRFLSKFIPLCLARNEKVLIFSQYKQPLKFIKEKLGEILDGDVEKEVLQLDGMINQEQRQNLITVFNDENSEAKIMLASTKCCSEGISLVGASRVVLLDVVWNPSVERQAICRAYRLGQRKVVYTYHLITSGTTEWEKYCKQAEKDRLSELVFSSSTSTENGGQKKNAAVFDDVVLDDMVNQPKLKEMFKKIIYQPKKKHLMDSFRSNV